MMIIAISFQSKIFLNKSFLLTNLDKYIFVVILISIIMGIIVLYYSFLGYKDSKSKFIGNS